MSVAWSQRWSLKGIATILVSEEPWDDWLPWVQERQQFMKKVMDYGFENAGQSLSNVFKVSGVLQQTAECSWSGFHQLKLMKTDWLCLQGLECSGAQG